MTLRRILQEVRMTPILFHPVVTRQPVALRGWSKVTRKVKLTSKISHEVNFQGETNGGTLLPRHSADITQRKDQNLRHPHRKKSCG